MLTLKAMVPIYRNIYKVWYSGAPHLRPFKTARVAQVRFAGLNEQLSVDSESKAHLSSYRIKDNGCGSFHTT